MLKLTFVVLELTLFWQYILITEKGKVASRPSSPCLFKTTNKRNLFSFLSDKQQLPVFG